MLPKFYYAIWLEEKNAKKVFSLGKEVLAVMGGALGRVCFNGLPLCSRLDFYIRHHGAAAVEETERHDFDSVFANQVDRPFCGTAKMGRYDVHDAACLLFQFPFDRPLKRRRRRGNRMQGGLRVSRHDPDAERKRRAGR